MPDITPEATTETAPPLPPPKVPHPKPIPADDGITLSDIWAKVANYRFSTHAFAGITTAAVATYLGSPQLQEAVNDFTKSHVKAALIGGAVIATWRNYAKAQKMMTVTATVQPGEDGVALAEASAGSTEAK